MTEDHKQTFLTCFDAITLDASLPMGFKAFILNSCIKKFQGLLKENMPTWMAPPTVQGPAMSGLLGILAVKKSAGMEPEEVWTHFLMGQNTFVGDWFGTNLITAVKSTSSKNLVYRFPKAVRKEAPAELIIFNRITYEPTGVTVSMLGAAVWPKIAAQLRPSNGGKLVYKYQPGYENPLIQELIPHLPSEIAIRRVNNEY